jgi:hypothetical protein
VKPARERRCVATGEIGLEAELLRVGLGPDGRIVPDVAAKLPGRGAWVRADRALVDKAVKKRLFNRAFGQEVGVPDDLAAHFEALLMARALSLLGLARRAGRLAVGFDAARQALGAVKAPAWRIEACDGARDGRAKLDRTARGAELDVRVAGCFSADALGAALGRSGIVHAVLAPGPEADGFSTVIGKLAGFREINPLRSSAEDG